MSAYPLPLPHPASEPVRCGHCGNILGIAHPPHFHSKRKGRTIHCFLPVRLECEDCGGATDIGRMGHASVGPQPARLDNGAAPTLP